MFQRVSTFLAVLGLIAVAPLSHALAQSVGSSPMGAHVLPSTYKDKGAEPLPPAMPGARTAEAPAAEPSKPSADMTPNDALFDAINRGDLASARDAINRGALLSTENVLGMTPLDLSIDLGRDSITSLLLSMQGAEPVSHGKPVQTVADTKPARRPPARKVQTEIKVQEIARVTPAPNYPQDPGTPDPSAGFLGFGNR